MRYEQTLIRRPRRVREPGAHYRATADLPDPDDELYAPERLHPEDELYLLGERCAQAYLQADQLHYEAMMLLADFDHRKGWEDTGSGSTAEWLAWRIGIKPGAARERLRTAFALEQLPATKQAMKGVPPAGERADPDHSRDHPGRERVVRRRPEAPDRTREPRAWARVRGHAPARPPSVGPASRGAARSESLGAGL